MSKLQISKLPNQSMADTAFKQDVTEMYQLIPALKSLVKKRYTGRIAIHFHEGTIKVKKEDPFKI